jgi:hypothetical protein
MALTMGFTATEASAQSALKGKFELPAATYWGDTLLQPGQYSIWMTVAVQNFAQIHLSGEGVTRTFMAVPIPNRKSGLNYLEVIDLDGTYVVRAFNTGLLGESLGFGVTKKVRSKAQRASARPALAVPVAWGAGS